MTTPSRFCTSFLFENGLPQPASTIHPISSCRLQNFERILPLGRAAVVRWPGCKYILGAVGLVSLVFAGPVLVFVGLIVTFVGFIFN